MKWFCNKYVKELIENSQSNISKGPRPQGEVPLGARMGNCSPFIPCPHLSPPKRRSFLRDFHKDNPIVKEVNMFKDCN